MRGVSRAIAMAFLAGAWRPEEMTARAAEALGRRHRFLLPLARRLCESEIPGRSVDELAEAIRGDTPFREAYYRADPRPRVRIWPLPEPRFGPLPGWLEESALPRWSTVDELAGGLGVSTDDVLWLAETARHHRQRFDARRWHYRHRWIRKRSGACRLLEAPKPRLKAVQRALLHTLLDAVPPHEAAHGFRAGRSPVTHAAAHAGRRVVVRLDLEDFFSAIGQARIRAIFAALGYPPPLERLLANLCCAATPRAVLASQPLPESPTASDVHERWAKARRLAVPHLPQGAPTSPALSNLAAFGLDVRLASLAREWGAVYTRYADDLVFSGGHDLDAAVGGVIPLIGAIAVEEGFAVRWHKTRVMRSGARQEVGGIVVNERPNLRRVDLDRLRAILTNCIRHGPHGQNRAGVSDFRAHLEGRIGWALMVSPARGRELQAMLAQIRWTA